MHIALIGMPGAGKSTVGRRLAEALGHAFVDSDKVLEAAHGRPLQQVLEALGAEAFMKAEAEVVIACADESGPYVISPGGSIVYSAETMRKLRETAIIVHLDAPLSTIEARVGATARGIIGAGEKTLAEIHAERAPLYRAWAMRTVAADRDVEDVAEGILKIIDSHLDRPSGSPRPGRSL